MDGTDVTEETWSRVTNERWPRRSYNLAREANTGFVSELPPKRRSDVPRFRTPREFALLPLT